MSRRRTRTIAMEEVDIHKLNCYIKLEMCFLEGMNR
jgi:hypothetical protein